MEISYWKSRWQKDKTGWHLDQVYPQLIKFWPRFSLAQGATVLVPLCGKSRDVLWLAERGYRVIGVETSPKALKQLRQASGQTFTRTSSHGNSVFRSNNIELWEADFLKLPAAKIPGIDAVYDKAAIVALPPRMRKKYADKMLTLCAKDTRMLLQSFEYEQGEMTGPPFSVTEEELRTLFGKQFAVKLLNERSMLEEVEKFRRRGLSSYFLEKLYLLS